MSLESKAKQLRSLLIARSGDDSWMSVSTEDLVTWGLHDDSDVEALADWFDEQNVLPSTFLENGQMSSKAEVLIDKYLQGESLGSLLELTQESGGWYPDHREPEGKSKPEFGVFIWNKEGKYLRKDAKKVFTSLKLAQKYCDKLNDVDSKYVVRTIRD